MARKKKFYDNGLSFGCCGCGNCCRLAGGKVYLNETELQDIVSYLQITKHEFIHRYVSSFTSDQYILKDGDGDACIFLTENKCQIYPVRPIQCRTFPFWSENLKSAYRWKIIAQDCPGIGQGRHYSYTEIRQIMKNNSTVESFINKEKLDNHEENASI